MDSTDLSPRPTNGNTDMTDNHTKKPPPKNFTPGLGVRPQGTTLGYLGQTKDPHGAAQLPADGDSCDEDIEFEVDDHGLTVSWGHARACLGHGHRGVPEDDQALVRALLKAKAPPWVEYAPGVADDDGWHLVRPPVEVHTFESDHPGLSCVVYWDHDRDQVRDAVPDGWAPDYSAEATLTSGQRRAPLVPSTRYTLTDPTSGVTVTITAEDDSEANEAAQEWILEGHTWDDNEARSTYWVDVRVTDAWGDSETITVTVDPPEPPCQTTEHDWQSPLSLVGGIKENPGVFANAGGTITTEICARCGAYRRTNTWAERTDRKAEGLLSVTYLPADDESNAWLDSLDDEETEG